MACSGAHQTRHCGTMRITSLILLIIVGAAPDSARPSDATMQAAVVRGASVRVEKVPRPIAGTGQVLVKIYDAGVNPADWQHPIESASSLPHGEANSIPGYDGSGVIEALGPGVTTFKIGDAVIIWSRSRGTYAQFVAVSANAIALKPKNLSFAEAAGVAHAGLAAWNMLVDIANVRPGQTVLVLGGAGGVGSAAVQIAKHTGAHVVATASARNLSYLKSIGADDQIDYATQNFDAQLRDIDIAVDAVDIDNAYRALAVVRRGGYLVSVGGIPTADQCSARNVHCSGPTAKGTPVGVVLKQLAEWSTAGQFKINVDRSFDLTDVLKAWQYSQAGHTRGKSVIHLSD